jgi:hypothetical protein
MSVSRGCCVLLGKAFATGRSLVQGSPKACAASECNFETPKMRRPRPNKAVEPRKKIHIYLEIIWLIYVHTEQ